MIQVKIMIDIMIMVFLFKVHRRLLFDDMDDDLIMLQIEVLLWMYCEFVIVMSLELWYCNSTYDYDDNDIDIKVIFKMIWFRLRLG